MNGAMTTCNGCTARLARRTPYRQCCTWTSTIVTGERRKARKKQTEGKRTYRKKADAVRLCADDLLTRERLAAYHDSYAAAMSKYGLQRGIRGSEARHTTTAQYYRDLKRQTGELEANMRQLQDEQQQAERQLDERKSSRRSWKPPRPRQKLHLWQRSVLFWEAAN